MFRVFITTILTALTLGCQSRPSKPVTFSSFADEATLNASANCCLATGTKIAVASGGKQSSKIAVEISKEGGNLVDSFVAAAFGLAVERPSAAGLGGGGFAMLSLKSKSSQTFLDFRETAPAKARASMYLDAAGEPIPNLSTDGALAVATPGFVAGLSVIHKKYGKLKWAQVLQPAINLAKNGFVASADLVRTINERKEVLSKDPYSKEILLSEKTPVTAGVVFKQPDIAKTLERIAQKGPDDFYRGAIAKQILKTIKKYKGILTAEDLKSYKPVFRKPIVAKYRGYDLLLAPPPSAGGIVFAQVFAALENTQDSYYVQDYIHVLSEYLSRSFADRHQYIGDPDVVSDPSGALLDPQYLAARMKFDPKAHTPSNQITPGKPGFSEAPNTTHISLIDANGDSISATITINTYFGSGLAVKDAGFFLNNEMDDFSIKPGTANYFGLTGSQANAIAPKKRPVSSMSPTIVLKNGTPVVSVGGAGGSRIITSTLQVLLSTLSNSPGSILSAVSAPRFHFQWQPDVLYLETPLFQHELKDKMITFGYEIREQNQPSARIQAVSRNLDDGLLMGVADPRDIGGASAE